MTDNQKGGMLIVFALVGVGGFFLLPLATAMHFTMLLFVGFPVLVLLVSGIRLGSKPLPREVYDVYKTSIAAIPKILRVSRE